MPKERFKIYLSHAIERRREGNFLEYYLNYMLGEDNIEIFNPFKYQGDIREAWLKGNHSKDIADQIMHKDLELIRDSDLVLTFVPGKESIGTSMEIFFARYHLKVPVIILIQEAHPWLVSLGACRVTSLETLVTEVMKLIEAKK